MNPVLMNIWTDLGEKLKIRMPDELLEELEMETVFTIPGTNITIDEGTVAGWIIIAAVFILALILTRNLKVEGDISKRQLFLEMCVDKMRTFFADTMGPYGEKYIPWLMTVAVYVGCSNIIGIFGLKPPTRSLNVTAALAVLSIILVEFAAYRQKGFVGRLKAFAKPAVVLPINILELVIKPMSLCFRLFGNVLGAFIIMKLVEAVFPIGLPVVFSLYFDIFDGFIQAYVFVFLTSLYIGEALEIEEEAPKKKKKKKNKKTKSLKA